MSDRFWNFLSSLWYLILGFVAGAFWGAKL